jgi:hypothetical protein
MRRGKEEPLDEIPNQRLGSGQRTDTCGGRTTLRPLCHEIGWQDIVELTYELRKQCKALKPLRCYSFQFVIEFAAKAKQCMHSCRRRGRGHLV